MGCYMFGTTYKEDDPFCFFLFCIDVSLFIFNFFIFLSFMFLFFFFSSFFRKKQVELQREKQVAAVCLFFLDRSKEWGSECVKLVLKYTCYCGNDLTYVILRIVIVICVYCAFFYNSHDGGGESYPSVHFG